MQQVQETPAQTIARLQAELAQAKQAAKPAPRGELSISPKGCIMFQPKGRKGWPVTLYAADWAAIFARQGEIQKFITDNAATLAQRAAGSPQ